MKKIVIVIAVMLVAVKSYTQETEKPLLGICSVNQLAAEPYASWYKPGYENYVPTPAVLDQLKKIKAEKTTLKIVFGTWCGDSKRELPRMLKALHAAGFSDANIELIGVHREADVYKQAPNREEKDLNVYRVPTFIVYEKGKEVGRINEFPVESLERDLLKIVSHQTYTPNYKSFENVSQWYAQGILTDPNISVRGLAEQIKSKVVYESELNSCGYVFLGRKNYHEAITVFRMNATLYPQSSNCFDSLGEAYLLAGYTDNAKACYQYAVELDPKNENAKTQLEKLK
jgi:tetratricopeptide (TPR) repeat protein